MVDQRLEFARSIGADATVKVSGSVDDMSKKILEVLGCAPDVTIECSGVESSIQLGMTVSTFKRQGNTVRLLR